MTDQEMNDAVAKACGKTSWLIVKDGWYYKPGANGYTDDVATAGRFSEAEARSHLRSSGEIEVYREPSPDYGKDLNAMHDAEQTLDEGQCGKYHEFIDDLQAYATQDRGEDGPSYPAQDYWFHSTAAQRREAFLRTICKFTDQSTDQPKSE